MCVMDSLDNYSFRKSAREGLAFLAWAGWLGRGKLRNQCVMQGPETLGVLYLRALEHIHSIQPPKHSTLNLNPSQIIQAHQN